MHASVRRSITIVLVVSGLGGCLSPAPSATGGDDGGSTTGDVAGTDTGSPDDVTPFEDVTPLDDVTPVEDGGNSDGARSDRGDVERDMSSWELPDRPPSVEACGLNAVPIPLSRWGMDVDSARIPNTGFAGEPELFAGPLIRGGGPFDGTALLFDGSSTNSHIEHHPMFGELAEGTITLWVRPHVDSLSETAVGLLTKDALGTVSDGQWGLRMRGGELTFRMQQQDATELNLRGNALTADQWHHVAVTWRNEETRLYLDGSINDEQARGWSLAANPEPVAVGFDTGDSADGTLQPADNYFHGSIDEITIWDSVLTPDQIAAFWSQGVGCPTPIAD